jgi:spore germination protein
MLIHIVSKGDTLYSIARQHGVSVARLMADNGLTENSVLVVGQAIIVTLPGITYRVRRGDTLSSIAAAYGITIIELIGNNPELIYNPNIQPGQQLTISFLGGKIREISLSGYVYPNVQKNILIRALPYITYLSIFSYGFKESGALIDVDDSELIALAYKFGAKPVMVLSSITEDGGFSSERVAKLLNDSDLQDVVLDNALDVIRQKGYVGLDMDFEYIPGELTGKYQEFLIRAADRLHSEGFFLQVDLAPKTSPEQSGILYEAHNYEAIGAIADRVFIMTYEWGYTYGPPLAVAPLDQVRRVIDYAVTEIPPEKILMGMPNYGYDWTLPYEQGISRAENIGNQLAIQRAAKYGVDIQFSETAKSPYFYYTTGGNRHVVWFEDVRSVEAKLKLADEYNLYGVGYWNLMRPFNQNWAFLSSRYNIRKLT